MLTNRLINNQPITELTLIKQSLKECEEITFPYKFTKNCWIKYITIKNDDEAFYEGGVFSGMGNRKIFLKNGKSKISVPTCIKDDDGQIMYRSRFFVNPNKQTECEIKKSELEKTVIAQQTVIKKMAEQLKLLEDSKQHLQAEHYDLVNLYQDKEQEVKELLIKEKKYKLLLSQYI